MNKEITNKILHETEAGYDLIAHKFSQTRKNFWRGLEWLGEYVQPGDQVLDYGCGNGRLQEIFADKQINYLGADTSANLLAAARAKYPQQAANFKKLTPSAQSLPFQSEFFNAVYSIAVFHHFPSQEYRQQMARELWRVTKPGGVVVITVWNLWQKRYVKNIFKNWRNKILEMLIRMSPFRGRGLRRDSEAKNLDWLDCEISFTDNAGRRIERFHHAFTQHELRKLFEAAGFQTEQCLLVAGRNFVYVGKK